MATGTVKWFNDAKGYGFITPDEGERLRVDHDGIAVGQLLGDKCRGTRVTFERTAEQVDPRAVNVTALPLFAARRARSRGRR